MMINSLCGSLKSENSCSSSNDPSIADLKKAPFLTQIDMEAKSPENSLWDHYFTDLFEGDFMISSPVRNFTSPQASNIKKLSPLHRVFNSPNNNNNNNQFMQTESLSQLELEGFLDGNYEREIDDLLAYMPIKNGWNLSSDCNDIYEGREAVAISLSEQLEQEREREKQLQQKLPPPHHQTLPPLHDASGGMVVVPPPTAHEQDNGLQLVHLLLACAEAASKDDYILARRYLSHLNRVVTPLGDSIQRVTSCFTQALAARLAATQNPKTFPSKPFTPFPPNSLETLKNYQILYQSLPFIKFSHYTANQAIFEAFDGEDCVHIIDLDILQGYQWPAFMQALAARPGGPPFLRITGIGPSENDVRETGRCLTELALSLNIPFEFHSVGEQLENLKPHMFNRKVGEALAVNSINILHRVPGNFLGNLLSTIRDQAPNIFVIVEQEASHNGPYFLGRFLEALHYYSAIFDSLDATFTMDSAQRARVEQCVFGPEIRNIVAAEGVERVIRSEKVEKWRKIMEGKGFERVALSSNAVTQSEILLGFYSCDGYRLTQDKGCLLLGWQDRPILAASAWRC